MRSLPAACRSWNPGQIPPNWINNHHDLPYPPPRARPPLSVPPPWSQRSRLHTPRIGSSDAAECSYGSPTPTTDMGHAESTGGHVYGRIDHANHVEVRFWGAASTAMAGTYPTDSQMRVFRRTRPTRAHCAMSNRPGVPPSHPRPTPQGVGAIYLALGCGHVFSSTPHRRQNRIIHDKSGHESG